MALHSLTPCHDFLPLYLMEYLIARLRDIRLF